MLMALALNFAVASHTLIPTDDVWVYPHASDQIGSEYLRSWGGEGRAVIPGGEQTGAYSFSGLKFSVKDIPVGYVAKKAVLLLTHDAVATFDEDQSKAAPLEVRPLSAEFDEASWEFSLASKVFPPANDDQILGKASVKPSSDGKPFVIEINLLSEKSKFSDMLTKAIASPGKVFAVALTTRMDPQETGESTMYKYYSRSAKEEWRPRLVLSD